MNKVLKIILIVISCIIVLGVVGLIFGFISLGNTANADEYKLGNDTIKSIKSVVEKRQVTSIGTKIVPGLTTKKVGYKSDTVYADLLKYTQYLRNEGGFILTKDMNLSETPSSVQLGKESNDSGELIMMTIEYDLFGYTIIIQKGKGTLTTY